MSPAKDETAFRRRDTGYYWRVRVKAPFDAACIRIGRRKPIQTN